MKICATRNRSGESLSAVDRKLFVNAALPLGANREAYSFANWRDYDANGSFFYRRPGVTQLLPVRLADGSIHTIPVTGFPEGSHRDFSAG